MKNNSRFILFACLGSALLVSSCSTIFPIFNKGKAYEQYNMRSKGVDFRNGKVVYNLSSIDQPIPVGSMQEKLRESFPDKIGANFVDIDDARSIFNIPFKSTQSIDSLLLAKLASNARGQVQYFLNFRNPIAQYVLFDSMQIARTDGTKRVYVDGNRMFYVRDEDTSAHFYLTKKTDPLQDFRKGNIKKENEYFIPNTVDEVDSLIAVLNDEEIVMEEKVVEEPIQDSSIEQLATDTVGEEGLNEKKIEGETDENQQSLSVFKPVSIDSSLENKSTYKKKVQVEEIEINDSKKKEVKKNFFQRSFLDKIIPHSKPKDTASARMKENYEKKVKYRKSWLRELNKARTRLVKKEAKQLKLSEDVELDINPEDNAKNATDQTAAISENDSTSTVELLDNGEELVSKSVTRKKKEEVSKAESRYGKRRTKTPGTQKERGAVSRFFDKIALWLGVQKDSSFGKRVPVSRDAKFRALKQYQFELTTDLYDLKTREKVYSMTVISHVNQLSVNQAKYRKSATYSRHMQNFVQYAIERTLMSLSNNSQYEGSGIKSLNQLEKLDF